MKIKLSLTVHAVLCLKWRQPLLSQLHADPTPNQFSTLVLSLLLLLVTVHKTENPSRDQLVTMAHQAVNSTPDQHSMVTRVTLNPIDKSACNHQDYHLTIPHTGQYVIVQ